MTIAITPIHQFILVVRSIPLFRLMDVKEDVAVTSNKIDGQLDKSILRPNQTTSDISISFVAESRCFHSVAITGFDFQSENSFKNSIFYFEK